MKRILFAVGALSAFGAGGVRAQSSVTLYGVLDQSVEYVNRIAQGAPSVVNGQLVSKPGGSRLSMPTAGGLSGPRWGLRGTEDLGGGAKAVFVLESGFGVDTGQLQQARLFGRQAYVGLQNQYGKLTFGRQYTAMFESLANFSPTKYSVLYEPAAWMSGINFRSDNTVKYSGQFGSLTTIAHYSFGTGVPVIGLAPLANGGVGETPGNPRDNAGWGAGLNYLNGSFGAGFAYDEWNPTITTGQPGKSRKVAGALSYTTGSFKLMGGYRWARVAFSDGSALARDDYWWAGVNYQVTGALELTLAYFYADLKSVRLTPAASSVNPANPWQVTLKADYSLSKRTDLYLTTAYARNAGLNLDTSAIGFGNGYFPVANQKDMVGIALGVRHIF